MRVGATVHSEQVQVGPRGLLGQLDVPHQPLGLVVFAHGSGSSRLSKRHRHVADVLHGRGLATLLFDLLDAEESVDRRKAFDIDLLSERVEQAIDWAVANLLVARLPLGLFGASTGAAAALVAAAARPGRVAAVVSRGGRPDLAEPALERVHAATLLIVGGADPEVLKLNRVALGQLCCIRRLEVVPGAGHLFEEPGALDCVVEIAATWFETHLVQRRYA